MIDTFHYLHRDGSISPPSAPLTLLLIEAVELNCVALSLINITQLMLTALVIIALM